MRTAGVLLALALAAPVFAQKAKLPPMPELQPWEEAYVAARTEQQELYEQMEYRKAGKVMRAFLKKWAKKAKKSGPGSKRNLDKAKEAVGYAKKIQPAWTKAQKDPATHLRPFLELFLQTEKRRRISDEEMDRLFEMLLKHDAQAKAYVDTLFPAKLVGTYAPELGANAGPGVEGKLVRLSAEAGIPIVLDGETVTTLEVNVTDGGNMGNLLGGMGGPSGVTMSSYAASIGARFKKDGSILHSVHADGRSAHVSPEQGKEQAAIKAGEKLVRELKDDILAGAVTGRF